MTIQGGGVYGLSLLGQLQGLLDEGVEPFALAGTSAGAIVATLFWAGLSPEQIRDHFAKLAESPTGLSDLVGPFRNPPFDYAKFRRTVLRYQRYLGFLQREFESDTWDVCGWPGRLVDWLRGLPSAARIVWDVLFPFRRLAGYRGLFAGDTFEHEIDKLLRASPLLVRVRAADPEFPPSKDVPGGRLLTFGDFHRWLDNGLEFFGPLFLTATNLVTRQLELIEFPNRDYFGLPVARAVRASAGFPFFFRPVNETYDNTRYASYVDGGVICNFPAFVFADTFRTRLIGRRDRADYLSFAARTWVHIGLRLGSDKHDQNPKKMRDPEEFLKAVFGLAAGGARSELEQRLAGVVSRSLTVEQPPERIGGPKNVLDIHDLTPEVVNVMFALGQKEAKSTIGAQKFDLPDARPIRDVLEDLVRRSATALGDPSNATLGLRSNVFIPQGQQLILRYSFNMDDPRENPDHEIILRDDQGLTGFCFLRRAPMLCNLQKLNEAFDTAADPRELFGLDPGLRRQVRSDRTWLLSVPIFDPYSLLAKRVDWTPDGHPEGPYYKVLETALDGAVFGVLNLDAHLPYADPPFAFDPDPANLVDDHRICTVRDIMLRAAYTIGGIFSAEYPGRK
ncbi:patatin-like phospholipase family protein [Gemmata sp. G18]|uniref:Patatin-like phospholipase family protein n=1 Tax=Gemmata palustris TaxID=2822762 RepID=A0ABS5BU30_9BACT|nr:patatin-like phospholipase family protein [Gemmata palustris]MBP3957165.1 patatin-like phospholipase family protein [Gemmata palustris]